MRTLLCWSGVTCWVLNSSFAGPPALTIYNQNFAVVRDTVPLELKAGATEVRFTGVTAQLEPDSVILRDPAGKHSLRILEQNYRNDPVSQGLLLSMFEGKTINFENIQIQGNRSVRELIPGKIIRSGFVPGGYGPYGPGGGQEQPIVEVNGKLQFSLPGQPLFPSLGDDTVLKPTLNWSIQSDQPGKFDAEVSYVTDGFTWEADYNLVAPEQGQMVDLIGWVTMNNQSGKTFENARIKLMAGDVNKIRRPLPAAGYGGGGFGGGGGGPPPVTEKSFDEYHLYTLARPTTLRDRQMKQVEFVRADGVLARTIYVYDGAPTGCRFAGSLNEDRTYGVQSNKKVWVVREFANAETNHLGLPLPKGKIRLYRRNDDTQLEFTGEDTIDHTPRDEVVHVNAGNAFDLVGERIQTDFKLYIWNPPVAVDPTTGLPVPPQPVPSTNAPAKEIDRSPWIDESFEIKLRNHKRESVEFRVVEHLYRWSNWVIREHSDPVKKTDAQTVEFRVVLKPDAEKVLTYLVHYSW